MNMIAREHAAQHIPDEVLVRVSKSKAVTAWLAAVAVGLLSATAVVMSATGMGF